MALLISVILILWIVIYPVDSAIQRLNNQGQMNKRTSCFWKENTPGLGLNIDPTPFFLTPGISLCSM